MISTSGGDEDLSARFRSGERAALEHVYCAYVARVDREVRRLLQVHGGIWLVGAASVNDLVQDSFARAFSPTARRAFKGLHHHGPYLLAIVRNTVVDSLRLQQREVLAGGAAIEAWLALNDIDAAAAPPSWIDPVTLARVRDYLGRLPPDLRSVHHRRYVLDEAQHVAADALGLSRQRIRTLEKRLQLGLVRELERVGEKSLADP